MALGGWVLDRRDCGPFDLISVPNLTKKCPKRLEFQARNQYFVRRVNTWHIFDFHAPQLLEAEDYSRCSTLSAKLSSFGST